jgi:hypothetical protein
MVNFINYNNGSGKQTSIYYDLLQRMQDIHMTF